MISQITLGFHVLCGSLTDVLVKNLKPTSLSKKSSSQSPSTASETLFQISIYLTPSPDFNPSQSVSKFHPISIRLQISSHLNSPRSRPYQTPFLPRFSIGTMAGQGEQSTHNHLTFAYSGTELQPTHIHQSDRRHRSTPWRCGRQR